MAQTLDYNKTVASVAAVNVPLLEVDLDIIQKLDDEPNDVGGLSAAELKETFDEAGNKVKEYINKELIPAVISDGLTEQSRVNAEVERITNEQDRVDNENKRIAAEQARVDETTGVIAQAAVAAEKAAAAQVALAAEQVALAVQEANRAQAEAERVSVPAAVGVYNLVLTDRMTGGKYALIVEDGNLVLLQLASNVTSTTLTLIDTGTGTAHELILENGTLKLREV